MMTLASMNFTKLNKHEMVEMVTNHMNEHRIDIACIQETHFNTNEIIEINGYNIYSRREQNQENKDKEIKKILNAELQQQ